MAYWFKEINSVSKSNLTKKELFQIQRYINIYIDNKYTKHHQVNDHIERNGLWNEFNEMRSLNTHTKGIVKGISPKYFAIVCQVLKNAGYSVHEFRGSQLESFERW